MLKSIKNMLPYPKDVKKKKIDYRNETYATLRMLCVYFEKLTGEKISEYIPEIRGTFDKLLHIKHSSSYSVYARIREQFYTRILLQTTFSMVVIDLEVKENGKSKHHKHYYLEQQFKDSKLTEQQRMLYERLPSPVLNGLAKKDKRVVYFTSNVLSGYFLFAAENPQLIAEHFEKEDMQIRELIKLLRKWCGNSYFPEEREILDIIGYSVPSNCYGGTLRLLRPNFFAILCFVDELLAMADNSLHFKKEDKDDI